MEDGNGKFKAQQFLKDLGLHFNVQMVGDSKKETNVIPFISSMSMRMDEPLAALAVHMRNLLITYTRDEVQQALNKEAELSAIEAEMKAGFYE